MQEQITPPTLLRVLNALGRGAHISGLYRFRPDLAKLQRRAQRATGLDDFGGDDFVEGMNQAIQALRTDDILTTTGWIAVERSFVRALINRLLRVEEKKCTPEVFTQELNHPLLIVGLPRTGTTLLHRLLCHDEAARPLRTWELLRPIAGPGPDKRLREAQRDIGLMKSIAPSLDLKHFVHPEEPEECSLLMDSTGVSLNYWALLPVYGYLDYFVSVDQTVAYQQYLEHLQIFQSKTPELRLTLKAPIHTASIGTIGRVIPNMLMVQTHRDPATVIGSVASLLYTFHSVLARAVDPVRLGAATLDLLATLLDRSLDAREELGTRVLDIYYEDLLSDPMAVVQKIYDHHDLPLTDQFRKRMEAHLSERPQHRFGKHDYSLEEWGLSTEQVHKRFARYLDTFYSDRTL